MIDAEKLERVNTLIERRRARLADSIDIGGASAAGMVAAHNQCFLRRCLYFAEAGAGTVSAGHGLASLTIARSLIETIASYLDFADQLEALLAAGDSEQLRDFARAAALGTPIEAAEGEAVSSTVRRQIEQTSRVRPGIAEEYDRLCDELNPTVFWTWIYFAQRDGETVRFPSIAQSDADYLQWMVASVQLLGKFETTLGRIEEMVGTAAR